MGMLPDFFADVVRGGPEAQPLVAPRQSFVFDIETGPLDEGYIRSVLPAFDLDSIGLPPGKFDPAAVKYGQTKDPEKRAAKLADAREKHDAAVVAWATKVQTAEADYWTDVTSRAALSPITGQVLVIGYTRDGVNVETPHAGCNDSWEREILKEFWRRFEATRAAGGFAISYGGQNFDVPFVFVRSIKLGLTPPEILDGGKWLSKTFVDLLERLKCGGRPSFGDGHLRAKTVARAIGLVTRPADVPDSGKDFYLLWRDDRAKALEYLAWDVKEEFAIAKAIMGVLS